MRILLDRIRAEQTAQGRGMAMAQGQSEVHSSRVAITTTTTTTTTTTLSRTKRVSDLECSAIPLKGRTTHA
jgi:hypothetical protein